VVSRARTLPFLSSTASGFWSGTSESYPTQTCIDSYTLLCCLALNSQGEQQELEIKVASAAFAGLKISKTASTARIAGTARTSSTSILAHLAQKDSSCGLESRLALSLSPRVGSSLEAEFPLLFKTLWPPSAVWRCVLPDIVGQCF